MVLIDIQSRVADRRLCVVENCEEVLSGIKHMKIALNNQKHILVSISEYIFTWILHFTMKTAKGGVNIK